MIAPAPLIAYVVIMSGIGARMLQGARWPHGAPWLGRGHAPGGVPGPAPALFPGESAGESGAPRLPVIPWGVIRCAH